MTVQEKVATVRLWRHKIPLPGGVVTPGSQDTLTQVDALQLPKDLTGLSVLDVGCSDGFYSFECERRGAARVLAIDNFSSVFIDSPSGFRVAHEILQSKVEFMESDVFALDATKLGQFDLVLFLGVFYHLRHPLLALERLATLCKGQLVMETETTEVPDGVKAKMFSVTTGYQPPRSVMEFSPGDEINRDPTTWWAPTTDCAEALLASCGFCGVKTVFSKFRRGIFHGFTPNVGDDAGRLVTKYGNAPVQEALGRRVGRAIDSAQVLSALAKLSIVDFGALKQGLAEASAKAWHQEGRWKTQK